MVGHSPQLLAREEKATTITADVTAINTTQQHNIKNSKQTQGDLILCDTTVQKIRAECSTAQHSALHSALQYLENSFSVLLSLSLQLTRLTAYAEHVPRNSLAS